MSVLLVIPARYASTRFPGKPLAKLKDADGQHRTLLEMTWQAAQQVKTRVKAVVATDDQRILSECERIGAEAILTSENCANGTERCAEAVQTMDGDYDLVVNLQGDAPLTPPWFIDDLIAALTSTPKADMATPVLRCDGHALAALRNDRANGRVGGTTAVFDQNNRALYFSKEVIPFTDRAYEPSEKTPVFHHVGVYAYRPAALKMYSGLAPSTYEQLEGLEQLRFLDHNKYVLCVEVDSKGHDFWELNNPEDVSIIETILSDRNS